MENILKDAKFGDKFVTKNGRVCIYWGANLDNSLPHAFEWKHKAIFEDGLYLYNINGGTCHPDDGFEIVSRYHEGDTQDELQRDKIVSCVPEMVDLGLPSGLLWAKCNVGSDSPEGYGDFFAWGETQGYVGITDEKKFKWNDYKLFNKYNTTDGKTVLEMEDDVVTVLYGSGYRMPTKTELEELLDYTIQECGVGGTKFISKTNGNSIFIPFAGFCENGDHYYAGASSYLWGYSRNEGSYNRAFALGCCCNGDRYVDDYFARNSGRSIRAVSKEKPILCI